MSGKEIGEVVKIELGRNLTKANALYLSIFVFLSCVILQVGIFRLNFERQNSLEFLEAEKKQVEQFVHYTQYGFYGITMRSESPPFYAVTFNRPVSELESFFDSGVRLEINNPLNGGNVFKKLSVGDIDFSWFLILAGGFLSVWGFFTFREKGYLRFLHNFAASSSIYLGLLLSRAVMILGALLLTGFLFYVQFNLLNGIQITSTDIIAILLFLLTAFLVMLFFLIAGAILGIVKKPLKGIIIALFTWFVFSFLVPGFLNVVFSSESETRLKSRYRSKIEKIEILGEFNRLVKEKSKETRTRSEIVELNKTLAGNYLDTALKEIEDLEREMIEETGNYIDSLHLLSSLTPVTFYKSLCNELSGHGCNEYIKFYKYNNEKRRDFVKFCLVNRMGPQKNEIVPFFQGDGEYLFKAGSDLPRYFGLGLILNTLYVILLFGFGMFRFKRIIYPLPVKRDIFENIDLKTREGSLVTLSLDGEDFLDALFNILSGYTAGLSGKFSLDGESLVTPERKDFFYLPASHDLPGEVKVKHLVSFGTGLLKLSREDTAGVKSSLAAVMNKRLKDLGSEEKINIILLFPGLKKSSIWLLDRFLAEVPLNFVKDVVSLIKKRKEKGILILETVFQGYIVHSEFDYYSYIYFDVNRGKYVEANYKGY